MSLENPEIPPENALFSMEIPAGPLSAIERSVKASLEAIKATRGIPASKAFLAQTAMELARSIDKGNAKGRAVAQESAQLVATLEILDPPAEEADPDTLPDDLKDLINAFAATPVPRGDGYAPASDAA